MMELHNITESFPFHFLMRSLCQDRLSGPEVCEAVDPISRLRAGGWNLFYLDQQQEEAISHLAAQ